MTPTPSIAFGTDGWRALMDGDFTFENVERVVQAYADVLDAPRGATVFLGHDRRLRSRDFAVRAAQVLAANGFDVRLSDGYCPTPCVSVMTKRHAARGGVVITASHNPAAWNGVKFKESYGGSASPEFTSKVEKRIAEGVTVKRTGGEVLAFDPHDDYIEALRARVDVRKIREAGWKIAYDPLFGAGAGFLEKALGQPVRQIHAEDDPTFGGLNPEPIEKNLGALMALVPSEGYDVGLATDGDADRIGAVDETGKFVTPHQIYALILNHLLERGERGDVVKTVSTTSMIDKIAAKHGLKVHETPIGFKHICQKFLEITPLIGGEESGGIGLPAHVYERDGLLCALLLLEIMSAKKKRLAALLRDLESEFGPAHFLREDVHLTEESKNRAQTTMAGDAPVTLAGVAVKGVNRLDGTKYFLEDGSWLLLRFSGTEPMVRVYAESDALGKTRALIGEGLKLTSGK